MDSTKRDPFVSVVGLHKAFDDIAALRGVGFDVELGSTVSLLGPSGCGKTTILRSIAGLESPDGGVIRIGGEPVFDAERGINVAAEKRQIGMVFQSYAVWPHMTVGENVGFPLKVRHAKASDIDVRVREALKLVGLDGFAGRPSTNLSGGQQQRVALARAIVHQPRLVLFDEPLSNLDAKLRQQMRTELKLLQARLGFTAIYVTHDQDEALSLSDRIVVMNHGRVEGMGSPRELFAAPPTAFVANFLGFDNILEGAIKLSTMSAESPAASASGSVCVALEGSMVIACPWRDEAAPSVGQRVIVAIRSDRIGVEPFAEGNQRNADGENAYEGRLRAAVYAGTTQELLIDIGAVQLRALGPGDVEFKAGERVTVRVRSRDCLAFALPNERGSMKE